MTLPTIGENMGTAPPHTCPRCKRIVPGGPCRRCARARELQRGTATARGYDAEWARYSRAWLQRFPWCGQRADGKRYAEHSLCVQRALYTRAEVTDHIRAIKYGGARLDARNHQSLCGACNRRKAIALEGGFGR